MSKFPQKPDSTFVLLNKIYLRYIHCIKKQLQSNIYLYKCLLRSCIFRFVLSKSVGLVFSKKWGHSAPGPPPPPHRFARSLIGTSALELYHRSILCSFTSSIFTHKSCIVLYPSLLLDHSVI